MENLLEKFDQLEQIPTSLMKEITEPAPTPAATPQAAPLQSELSTDELKNLTGHTNTGNFAPTSAPQPQNSPILPNTGNQPVTGAQSLNAGNMVTPEMAVQFFNILIPAAICILINRFTKNRVVKTQFEATNKELEIIKPVLGNYLNSINFTVDSPLNALLITVAFVYGSKTIEALNNVPKGTIKTAEFNAPNVSVKTPGIKRPTPQAGQPVKKKRNRPSGMTYKKGNGHVPAGVESNL